MGPHWKSNVWTPMDELNSTGNVIPDCTENRFSVTETTSGRFSDNEVTSDMETSEATIRRVLSSYLLGPKLRQLRLRKKIALIDLGKHTGLSASMLSQLENGKLVPTLPTLTRIAMVFDVGLDHFFGQRRGRKTFAVVKRADRIRFPERPDLPAPTYFFECLAYSAQAKGMQAYLAEFPARKQDDTT